MVEGGTPNTLLRRGITRDSLKVGTELVIDGYQARDHSLLRANGRNVTYPGRPKLFLGRPAPARRPTAPIRPSRPKPGHAAAVVRTEIKAEAVWTSERRPFLRSRS